MHLFLDSNKDIGVAFMLQPLGRVVSVVAIPLLIFAIGVLIRMIFASSKGLVVNEEGITLLYSNFGLIKWSDIESFKLVSKESHL
jgi:hypothetical protein